MAGVSAKCATHVPLRQVRHQQALVMFWSVTRLPIGPIVWRSTAAAPPCEPLVGLFAKTLLCVGLTKMLCV